MRTLSSCQRRIGEVDVPPDGKTTEELVSERLALSDGGKTTVLDLLSVELERVLRELETLLDESGELTNAAALFAEDFLGVGGTDDNLSVTCEEELMMYPERRGRTSVRAWVTRTSQPE